MIDWTFGYDGWLVWDGEYPDLEVGGTFQAAIEFWPIGNFASSDSETLEVQALGNRQYEVTAKVIEIETFVVLDLGPLAVSCMARSMSAASELQVGQVIQGKIGLGLDPFGHYGKSAGRKKVWTVDRILCTRYARYPSLARSLGDEAEEIQAISTDLVDSGDSCVIGCSLATGD